MKNQYKWIPVSALYMALAACGGGSDAPPATPLANIQGKVAYDAYASPAGMLCANSTMGPGLEETCEEPTSSSVQIAQLNAYLLNPEDGKFVHFTTTGFNLLRDKNGIYTYGGMLSRDVYVGRHRFMLESNTYGPEEATFGPIGPGMHYMLAGGDTSRQLIFETGYAADFSELRRQNLTPEWQPGFSVPLINWDNWTAKLGLRSDWLDAPDETLLTYTGAVNIQGDTGRAGVINPETGGTVASDSSVDCDIDAVLDLKLSQIRVQINSCTSAVVEMGTTAATFDTTEWHFDVRKSVVSKGMLPIQVKVSNPGLQLSVDQTIADITGGIYGSQARTIYIEGHGANSAIRLIAMRPELLAP
ncbi:hypothetical protein [Aquabacterium sp.]|uniref:hypothetical protein n=1 Tax=Aquabacterium sp. TaxID=1872578 RepID=UPI00198937EB|nr:hypothetical protein [Aquabacterium sp.]MBC7700188.1 hypothetical protein [Aquabacterium sp.]